MSQDRDAGAGSSDGRGQKNAGDRVPAAVYIRMWTELQRYSIDNQMDAIEAYAESNRYKIVRTCVDSGRSGLTLGRLNPARLE